MAQTVVRIADHQRSSDSETHPLANTRAARLFAGALERLSRDQNTSQRDLAKSLGYKSSVVISHMASGRAPIPIERVPDFIRHMKLPPAEFLLAVLEQRFPNIDFMRLLVGSKNNLAKVASSTNDEEVLVLEDLQSAAGSNLADLTPAHLSTLREVAADRNANRRWMSIPELGVMDVIRREAPRIAAEGLSPSTRKAFKDAVAQIR